MGERNITIKHTEETAGFIEQLIATQSSIFIARENMFERLPHERVVAMNREDIFNFRDFFWRTMFHAIEEGHELILVDTFGLKGSFNIDLCISIARNLQRELEHDGTCAQAPFIILGTDQHIDRTTDISVISEIDSDIQS